MPPLQTKLDLWIVSFPGKLGTERQAKAEEWGKRYGLDAAALTEGLWPVIQIFYKERAQFDIAHDKDTGKSFDNIVKHSGQILEDLDKMRLSLFQALRLKAEADGIDLNAGVALVQWLASLDREQLGTSLPPRNRGYPPRDRLICGLAGLYETLADDHVHVNWNEPRGRHEPNAGGRFVIEAGDWVLEAYSTPPCALITSDMVRDAVKRANNAKVPA